MWAYENTFYQWYPLNAVGAPFENDGILTHRITALERWIPHLQKLGIGAVYFSPIFESDTHGYNTRDYRNIDVRLGTNDDFAHLCKTLHSAGIRVVLDGVFNHVGRGFFAFQDVLAKQEQSQYCDWFYIDFGGNSNYNDGLWYEGWEGHFDLVKLNLNNEEVVSYLLDSVKFWIDCFGIDGLRLDVAYMVDQNFLRRLRAATAAWKDDFVLIGEMIGGDYNAIMGEDMCHSVTNYECYKGMYSSLNSRNLFEIAHSLQRQFGSDPGCLYRGRHLLSFVDNHDVTRAASILQSPEYLPLLYGLMFGIPGFPCIYYGSEWAIRGEKSQGDNALRPAVEIPEWNDLTTFIAKLCRIRSTHPCLQYGRYRTLALTNNQFVFEREGSSVNSAGDASSSRLLIAMNLETSEYTAHFDARAGRARDLISDEIYDFGGGLQIPPCSILYLEPF